MIVRTRWVHGPVTEPPATVVVAATKADYKRVRDLPFVFLEAVRLMRRWRHRSGSLGVLVAGEPGKTLSYSMSAWESRDALRSFLRAPDHVPLMRRYRPRQTWSMTRIWETDDFTPAKAWREAIRRLNEPEGTDRRSSSPRARRPPSVAARNGEEAK
jgi:hypothetical protein